MDSFKKFKEIYKNQFFSLEQAESLKPNIEPYFRLTGNDCVICLILNENDEFIMVKQFRPSLEKFTLETPAGAIEDSETPFEAAKREIREEVGIKCSLLSLGQHFHLMMNRTNEKTFLFFGMETFTLENFVYEEGIEVINIPRRKLFELFLNGEYFQLAGISIIKLIEIYLGIDMYKDSYLNIYKKFKTKMNDV